jgi:hypothetical protein
VELFPTYLDGSPYEQKLRVLRDFIEMAAAL